MLAGAENWLARTAAVAHFSWAVPTLPIIMEMAAFSSRSGIVEIGAGLGYWSKLLQTVGADIRAVDNHSEIRGMDGEARSLFFTVENADGRDFIANGKAEKRTLFFCWPRGSFGAEKGFPGYSGDRVVFVGAETGDCTADISEDLVNTGEWEVVKTMMMPRWSCINDICHFLQRRSSQ